MILFAEVTVMPTVLLSENLISYSNFIERDLELNADFAADLALNQSCAVGIFAHNFYFFAYTALLNVGYCNFLYTYH